MGAEHPNNAAKKKLHLLAQAGFSRATKIPLLKLQTPFDSDH